MPKVSTSWANKRQALIVAATFVVIGISGLLFSLAAEFNPKADIDKSGAVDTSDVDRLLATFGGIDEACDLNNDGLVTLADLSILLSNVGKKPPTTPPTQSTTIIGLHTGARDIDYRATRSLKPKIVRVGGLNASMSRAEIEGIANEYATLGTRIIALVDFNGAPPSEADSRNLGTWATIPGIEAIEFGNEPWISPQDGGYFPDDYTASDPNDPYNIYAARFKIAQQAVEAANPNMPLLAVVATQNRSHRPGLKVAQAMKAIGVKPKGVQFHPYGPGYMDRLDEVKRDLSDIGWGASNVAIWATEVGVSTDNGRELSDNYNWNRAMTYEEAGQRLREITSGLSGGGVKRIIIYMGTDYSPSGAGQSNNREWYFGLTKHDGSDKGSLSTTARQLFNQ